MKIYIAKAARWFLNIIFNNGAQYTGKLFKISFFPSEMGNFTFLTCQVWSNCQVYKLQFIRTWITKNRNKNTWGSDWRKNKIIEARQSVTGSYEKEECIRYML